METTATRPIPARRLEDAVATADAAAIVRLRRWGGDRLVHDLVQLFDQLTPTRLADIRLAVARADAPSAEAAAHSLGSSCGQLGAPRAQRICIRIERLAGEGQLDAVPPLLAEVEVELSRFRPWLAEQAAAREAVA